MTTCSCGLGTGQPNHRHPQRHPRPWPRFYHARPGLRTVGLTGTETASAPLERSVPYPVDLGGTAHALAVPVAMAVGISIPIARIAHATQRELIEGTFLCK